MKSTRSISATRLPVDVTPRRAQQRRRRPMKKRKLGARGPEVGMVGLGCMTMSTTGYGPQNNEAEAIATLHRAIDLGVDFLDTADIYGENEVLIAKGIAGKRKGLFLATKCGLQPGGVAGGHNGTPEHIHKSIDKSLQRLK